MKTFGKLSFYLYILSNILALCLFLYFIYIGVAEIWFLAIYAIILIVFLYHLYHYHLVIKVSQHELVVEWPFRKKKLSWFINDIQAVSLDVKRNSALSRKRTYLMIYKKDNSEEEILMPYMIMEYGMMLKEFEKHLDVI